MDDPMLPKLHAQAQAAAIAVGECWKYADIYYDGAEPEMDGRWEYLLSPYLTGFDFSVCVDLAAGHGRNTRKLLEQSGCNLVYCIDINESNVEFCLRRFQNEPRVRVVKTDG